MKVAFIGLGNMGASLAKAVAKEVASTDLLLVNRSPQKVEEFISQYGGGHLFRCQTLPNLPFT